MIKIKKFDKKKIKIRKISKKDLKNVRAFHDFINSLVVEEVQIPLNHKFSLKKTAESLKSILKDVKEKRRTFLIMEDKEGLKIIGTAGIQMYEERQNHIGGLGINIRKEFRGLGLGNYLLSRLLESAGKELKPFLKIIKLSIFVTNKLAINLYKKYGFKKVAIIPHQFQHQGKLIDELVMLLYL